MARAFADRAVQMLAIARVLIGVPRLLLVDENRAKAWRR
jgi:ABC-type branched-subunit amino acid transport system ATPase component